MLENSAQTRRKAIAYLMIALFLSGFFLTHPSAAYTQALPVFTKTNQPANSSQVNGTDLNLSLSPPITYLSIKPGETKAIPLTIKNLGNRDLAVQLQLAEFTSDGRTGQPVLNLNPATGSQFTYLKPRSADWNWGEVVTLKHDQTVQVWLDLVVPTTAKTEERHLTVLVKGSRVSPEAVGASSIAGSIGSNIVVAIANEATNLSQIEFADWQISRYIDSLRGIDITGLVKNTGTQAGPILGRASILAPSGQMLKTWLFYPDMVLPGSTREVRVIDITADPTAEPSTWFTQPNVKPITHLQHKPTWLLGNYSLKLELYAHDYTPAQPRWERVIQITAFPFGLLAICLAVPILYGLVSWLRKITWTHSNHIKI